MGARITGGGNTRITSSRDRGITRAGQSSKKTQTTQKSSSSSSSSNKPKIVDVSESERQANMLITSDIDRKKGINRTKEALAKSNNDKAKEAFEKANGNIPALNGAISLVHESIINSDMMKDSKGNVNNDIKNLESIVTKRTISSGAKSSSKNPAIVPNINNVAGANIINIEGIKNTVSNIINTNSNNKDQTIYTKDEIMEMPARERAEYNKRLREQAKQEQKAYNKAEQDFRNEMEQERQGGIIDRIKNIDEKYSEYIPTLNDISKKGQEFREAHPEAADAIYNTMTSMAGTARTGTNKIDKDLGLEQDTVGTAIGQFSVGAYEGFQEKPVSTTAKTLAFAALPGAIGVAGKAIGSAGAVVTGTRVGAGVARIVSPVVTPIVSRIATPTGLKAAEYGMGGLFGAQLYNEVTAPIVTEKMDDEGNIITDVRKPTVSEMAYRSGDIFTTEVVPLAAGLGISEIGTKAGSKLVETAKNKFDYAVVRKTEPQQLIIKTEVPVAKPEPIPKTNEEIFEAAKNNRSKLDAEMKASSNTAEQSEMQAKYDIGDSASNIKDKINYDTKPNIDTFIGKMNDDVAELYTKVPIGKEAEIAKIFESGNVRRIRTNEGSFIEFEPKMVRDPVRQAGFNTYNSAKTANSVDDIGKTVVDDIDNSRLLTGTKEEEQLFLKGSEVFKGSTSKTIKQKIEDVLPYRLEKKVNLEPAELVSSSYKNTIIETNGGFRSNAVGDIEAATENRMIKGIDEIKLLSESKSVEMPTENIFTTKTTFNRKTNTFNTEVEETRMLNNNGDIVFKKSSFTTSQKLENGKPDMIFEDNIVKSVAKKDKDFIVTENGLSERRILFDRKTGKTTLQHEPYKPNIDNVDDIDNVVNRKPVTSERQTRKIEKATDDISFEAQRAPEIQTSSKRRNTTFKDPEPEFKIDNKSQIDDLFNRKTKNADIEVKRPKEFEGRRSSKGKSESEFESRSKSRIEVKPRNTNTNTGRGIKPIVNTRRGSDPFSESMSKSNTDPFAKDKNKPNENTFSNSVAEFDLNTASDTSSNTKIDTKTDTKAKPIRVSKADVTMVPIIPPVIDFDDNKNVRKAGSKKKGRVLRVKNKVRDFEDMI